MLIMSITTIFISKAEKKIFKESDSEQNKTEDKHINLGNTSNTETDDI